MHIRRFVIAIVVAALAAHVVVLAFLGDSPLGSLLSDLIQFFLGVAATGAAAAAARRSGIYAWKVWGLIALALGIYTAGQGIVVYYNSVLHASLFSPWISDQFLFFWIVPLVIAVLIDRWSVPRRIDWALVLDSSQVFLVALSLHLAAFAMSHQWEQAGRQLAFLEWRVRMVRDAIVLAALLSKVVLSSVPKTRSLFVRISIFFIAYSVADAIYLYAEAAWQNNVGTYLDLLWSVPRVLLICGAVLWVDAEEATQAKERNRRQTLPLHLASVLGPLFVALVGLRINSGSPKLAAALVTF